MNDETKGQAKHPTADQYGDKILKSSWHAVSISISALHIVSCIYAERIFT